MSDAHIVFPDEHREFQDELFEGGAFVGDCLPRRDELQLLGNMMNMMRKMQRMMERMQEKIDEFDVWQKGSEPATTLVELTG
jgi:hypothetical protein